MPISREKYATITKCIDEACRKTTTDHDVNNLLQILPNTNVQNGSIELKVSQNCLY